MHNEEREPFCLAPWVSIQYGAMSKGGVTPCCEWNRSWDPYYGPLSSYFSSQWLTTIKEAMLNKDMDIINLTCSSCIDLEKLNIISTRQRLTDKRLTIDSSLRIVDYRPSNLCNLKCRMCGPSNSSMIAKEENVIIPELDKTEIYQLDFSTITDIKILGGEPSISSDVSDFLEYLIDTGFSKNINFMTTTNATNANKAWIDLITKFKSCYVIISLDGIGKVYEYIRTNANWNSVLKNIKVYQSLDNISYSFQVTTSMYNMPVVEDWIEWFFDKDTNIYPVDGFPELSLAALPDDIRQEKIEYLKKFNNSVSRDAISILSSDKFDKSMNDKFKDYTYAKDKIRNTNILDVSAVFKKVLNT